MKKESIKLKSVAESVIKEDVDRRIDDMIQKGKEYTLELEKMVDEFKLNERSKNDH